MSVPINIDSVELPAPKRRSTWFWLFSVLALIGITLVIAGAIIWWQREPIATQIVNKELEKLGLPATYEIEEIGPQTQIIRNIVVGPKDRPDLTVKSAIVEMRWGWNGPYPVRIIADDVHLRGRFSGGKLSFGSLDRLRNPDSAEPFKLPDIDLVTRNARISLATDYGPMGIALTGNGNPASNFAGKLAVSAPKLSLAGCLAETAAVSGQYALADGAPSFTGPASLASVDCGATSPQSGAIRAVLTANIAADFQNWSAETDVTATDVASGPNKAAMMLGTVSGKGTFSTAILDYDMRANRARSVQGSAEILSARGDGALNWSGQKFAWTGNAEITAKRSALDPAFLAQIRAQSERNGSLPFDPVITKAAGALARAGSAFDAVFPVTFEGTGNAGRVVVRTATITSASGAQIAFSGGQGMAYALPSGQLALSGTIATSGGNLPSITATVQRNPRTGAYSGRAIFAPYTADSAAVTFDPLNFQTTAGGITFATALGFSGPLPGGKVDRAYIPLVGTYGAREGLVLAGGCTTVRFAALTMSGMQAGQSSLPLCAAPGQPLLRVGTNGLTGTASIPNLRWAGRVRLAG